MRLISRFIAFLLALLIISTAASYIAGNIIWNPIKLQQAAQSSGVAEKTSLLLPEIIASKLALSGDEKFIIKTVVTKERIAPVINQILTHIAIADSTPLSFDLSNYRQAISSEGLPLPTNLEQLTSKPVTIISSELAATLASTKKINDQIRLFAPILAIFFAILILIFAKRKRFLFLAEAFLSAGIGLGLIGLASPLIPKLAVSSIGTSPIAPLKDVIFRMVTDLSNSAQNDFYLAGITCGVIAAALFVLHGLIVIFSKFSKKRHHG